MNAHSVHGINAIGCNESFVLNAKCSFGLSHSSALRLPESAGELRIFFAPNYHPECPLYEVLYMETFFCFDLYTYSLSFNELTDILTDVGKKCIG